MEIIPDIIKEIAANEGCNHVEFVGTLDKKRSIPSMNREKTV